MNRTMPDYKRWATVLIEVNATYERTQNQVNNIAIALEQAFNQGRALEKIDAYPRIVDEWDVV